MGWTYLTYPFTENNWILLIFAVIFSVVAAIIAFSLEGKRDMDRGYLPERQGRGNAKQSLLSVPSLFIKINKGIIIAWLIAFIIMGAAYGSIYGDMATFIESNELIQQMFTASDISIEESFTSTIMLVMIFFSRHFAYQYCKQALCRRKPPTFKSTFHYKSISWTILLDDCNISCFFCEILGILFAAGSLGSTAIYSMDNHSMDLMDFLTSGYNFLPSVLFYTGLASLALGWVPRLGKFVYIYLGYSFVLSYFNNILDLPEWFFLILLSKTGLLICRWIALNLLLSLPSQESV